MKKVILWLPLINTISDIYRRRRTEVTYAIIVPTLVQNEPWQIDKKNNGVEIMRSLSLQQSQMTSSPFTALKQDECSEGQREINICTEGSCSVVENYISV